MGNLIPILQHNVEKFKFLVLHIPLCTKRNFPEFSLYSVEPQPFIIPRFLKILEQM